MAKNRKYMLKLSKRQKRDITCELWGKSQLCGICGKQLPGRDHKGTTLDHVKPLSKGGEDVKENLQLAHIKCNNLKADKLPEEKAI